MIGRTQTAAAAAAAEGVYNVQMFCVCESDITSYTRTRIICIKQVIVATISCRRIRILNCLDRNNSNPDIPAQGWLQRKNLGLCCRARVHSLHTNSRTLPLFPHARCRRRSLLIPTQRFAFFRPVLRPFCLFCFRFRDEHFVIVYIMFVAIGRKRVGMSRKKIVATVTKVRDQQFLKGRRPFHIRRPERGNTLAKRKTECAR